ncbi:MAG TPA: FAD-dependent oxidoreductase [Acidimicrobiales bacterium]|nr:FAD-dependent oxidoreductase [Acidimicrobiales bacterium]
MPSPQTFVIVGAGLAGAKAAETLRAEGFEGRVLLLGEEPVRPYERPPLSKEYLRGEKGFDQAAVHDADFYETHNIELRTGAAVLELDLGSREVVTASKERAHFDRLLLATGTVPRQLTVPGAELDGVFYLRTVADADALRSAITKSTRVVVIGAGWIGSEVAASARQLGADVSIVELASLPLERALGPEVGAVYRDLHAAHGVDLHLTVGVANLEGGSAVERVRLSDGTVLPADIVVVGIGVVPRDELARTAGIPLDNGVAVDAQLATAVPGVYAAGDVANAFHPLYGNRVRLEHWSAALNQGPVAAKNMLGQAINYERMPYFFSDQYDMGMEYRGWAPHFERVVFRGDPKSFQFLAFWLQDQTVVAAMNANIWDMGDTLEALLRARRRVDPVQLADPDIDLADLADLAKN